MNTTAHITQFKNFLTYRRYSPNTIKTYTDSLEVFFRFHQTKEPERLSIEDIIEFNTEYILQKNLSASYQNQVINAIKLFYRNRFNRFMDLDNIQRPRREKRLPNVLSKAEVKAIIEAPVNLKHRAMLSLIYACGLRRSELLNLTLKTFYRIAICCLYDSPKGKRTAWFP
jgi:integrase/recombinase XerD